MRVAGGGLVWEDGVLLSEKRIWLSSRLGEEEWSSAWGVMSGRRHPKDDAQHALGDAWLKLRGQRGCWSTWRQ